MPTGTGKSVCYQLPATRPSTLTLVISPLRALMRDQVTALERRGVPCALIDSGVAAAARRDIYAQAQAGALRLLYVAPERLWADDFQEFARGVRFDLIAVDEAHCVLQWGHDFRSSYLHIGDWIAGLPSRPVVAAFTATATRRQVPEIAANLGLHAPVTVATGFDRPNIRFDVVKLRPRYRRNFIAKWIQEHEGSGIVYCNTIKECDTMTQILADLGVDAKAFYAPLADDEKAVIQDGFLKGSPRVICATTAFGMGVDKPDVRWVVNDGMSESIESFYQEAGRAGRDGKPARSVTVWCDGDINGWHHRIRANAGNAMSDPRAKEKARKAAFERLTAMEHYCENNGECLRRIILDYFDSDHETPVGGCNNCGSCKPVRDCGPTALQQARAGMKRSRKTRTTAQRTAKTGTVKPQDKTEPQQVEAKPYEPDALDEGILAFIRARQRLIGHGFGNRKTLQSLQGLEGPDVSDQGLDRLEGYASCGGVDDTLVMDRIHALVDARLIAYGAYHTLIDPTQTDVDGNGDE